MKDTRVRKVSALVMMILIINMAFVTAVSAETDSVSLSTNERKEVKRIDLPEIEVIEETNTSAVVQVGDILFSLESDSEYGKARMNIKDLNTNEVHTLDYEVSEVEGKYETTVYYEGKLYNKVILDYNCLKPGELNEVSNNQLNQSNMLNSKTLSETTYFEWDGVNFVKGDGIKYPHPDYDYYSYKGETWESWSIGGDDLEHCHLSSGMTATLVPLAPVAIGAAIGGLAGSALVAAAGAGLGHVMGTSSTSLLADEEGCLWYWKSYD